MYLNLIKCGFVLMTSGILIVSLLINFFETYLPVTIVQTFRYGKFSYVGQKSFINYFEVPKSWFKHFYYIAASYLVFILCLMVNVYVFANPAPEIVLQLLDLVATAERRVTINASSVYVAMALFSCQIWRRLYETSSLSVFSDSKINIVHYLVGIAHYVGALTAIIAESPGFAKPSFKHNLLSFSLRHLGIREVLGVAIFLWAWYHQYRTAVILANLRKDGTGAVVSFDHKLPVGGLFNRLSSPHMFCEMLLYLALNIILWGHTTWPYVFFWVFCNQCETALLNHWWYKSTFKSYPRKRKAYLPFIL